MSVFSKESFLGKEGPFTQNYKFYVESSKKIDISLKDQPDLKYNTTKITAYCRNDKGNFHIGERDDYNLSLLLQDKRYKTKRSFVKITDDVITISVTFEMYKKYKAQ